MSLVLTHSLGGEKSPTQLLDYDLIFFYRDQRTKRDDFVFYSKRLMRIVIEYALSFLPFEVKHFPIVFD